MSQPLIFEVEVDARAASIQIETPKVSVATSDPRVIYAVEPGQRGIQGLPGEGVPIFGEELIGEKDGVNQTFTTVNNFRVNSTAVYIGGLRERYYTENLPNTIIFEDPPGSTEVLLVDYILQ